MILYLDTSSMVKLYVEEAHSNSFTSFDKQLNHAASKEGFTVLAL